MYDVYVHTFQLQPDFFTVRTPTKQQQREKEKEKEKEKERWHGSNLKNEKAKQEIREWKIIEWGQEEKERESWKDWKKCIGDKSRENLIKSKKYGMRR